MPVSIRTEPPTLADRDSFERTLESSVRGTRSPVIPIIAATLGIVCVVFAFRIWRTSLEAAATLIFVGAALLATGTMVAVGRISSLRGSRGYHRDLRERFRSQPATQVELACDAVIPVPEFDEGLSAALFRIGPDEWLFVREDVLSFIPSWRDGRYPQSLTFRIVAGSIVVFARPGTRDAPGFAALGGPQRVALFKHLEAQAGKDGIGFFHRVPARIFEQAAVEPWAPESQSD